MSKIKFRKPTRLEVYKFICNSILVLLGNILIAFGSAIFLTKLNIVAGGLTGVGIIFQHFLGSYFPGGQIIDIVVFIITWILWVIGLLTLGKDFAIKTLMSSIFYPFALALFLRVEPFQQLAAVMAYYGYDATTATVAPISNLLLCGIFGGVFVGGGVALTFLGGGSSGGVDVLVAMIAKFTPIKESIASFIVDGTIIVLGMFIIPNNIVPALCGTICAFVTALMIEIVYNGNQQSYQVDIISDKWEEIKDYASNVLDRGTTIIHAQGGYKGEDRIILRIVFDRKQYIKIKDFIASVDPKAFVTFTRTNAVYGEGFKSNVTIKQNKK